MVVGLGMDVIEIARVHRALLNQHFLQRVYTPTEIAYCEARGKGRVASYAARFAAKEAALKALGTGLRMGTLQEVEVQNDALGKPCLFFYGVFQEKMQALGATRAFLSLTHAQDYAAATCILERE